MIHMQDSKYSFYWMCIAFALSQSREIVTWVIVSWGLSVYYIYITFFSHPPYLPWQELLHSLWSEYKAFPAYKVFYLPCLIYFFIHSLFLTNNFILFPLNYLVSSAALLCSELYSVLWFAFTDKFQGVVGWFRHQSRWAWGWREMSNQTWMHH